MRTIFPGILLLVIGVHVCAGNEPREDFAQRSVQVAQHKHDPSRETHHYKKEKWHKSNKYDDNWHKDKKHYDKHARKEDKTHGDPKAETYYEKPRRQDSEKWQSERQDGKKNVMALVEERYNPEPLRKEDKTHGDAKVNTYYEQQRRQNSEKWESDRQEGKKNVMSQGEERGYNPEPIQEVYDNERRHKRDVEYKGNQEGTGDRNEVEAPKPRDVADVASDKKVAIQYLPEFTSPPDPNNTIMMARYIVHTVDWAGIATTTSRGIGGAFGNILSMSDGTIGKGSGVPYFYMTALDLSTQDISKDNRASITVTLAQTEHCRKHSLDPEDPRCARLILSGKIKRIRPGSPEDEFAKEALFSRHPVMRTWPSDHGFFAAKLKIGQLILLDQFGGPKYLSVKEYLDPVPAATE